MPVRIALFGDGATMAALRPALVEAGWRVDVLGDGAAARRAADCGWHDLILVDLDDRAEPGLRLLHALVKRTRRPIVALGSETDPEYVAAALDMGAADYVRRPVDARELVARVRRRLDAGHGGFGREPSGPPARLAFGRFVLDLARDRLTSLGGDKVPLPGAEFRLLRLFVLNAGVVLARHRLYAWLKGRDEPAFDRSIDLLVSRLRRHLGDDAAEPAMIATVRGQGYVFTPDIAPLDDPGAPAVAAADALTRP